MKKRLLKDYETFQGKKFLKSNKNYFEGWYYKITNGSNTIAFIPGINIDDGQKKAFIQVITNDQSYFIDYDIIAFSYKEEPFSIEIGNNYFSKDFIHINIDEDDLKITGNIKLVNKKSINKNLVNPNIMGPFSYLPAMECNHAIISMESKGHGYIKINDKKIKFKKGKSYIEKDWGISFPKKYIWLQGNCFNNQEASFMLSIAKVPFKIFTIHGLICALIIGNQEYRFATYNGTLIKQIKQERNKLYITLKRGKYVLNIVANIEQGHKLSAPVKGKMVKAIYENLAGEIKITLKKENIVIFSDISTNCGIEIVK